LIRGGEALWKDIIGVRYVTRSQWDQRGKRWVEEYLTLLGTCQSKSTNWFYDSISRKVSYGWSTKILNDPWLSIISLRICFSMLFQVSIRKEVKVIDMIVREGFGWF